MSELHTTSLVHETDVCVSHMWRDPFTPRTITDENYLFIVSSLAFHMTFYILKGCQCSIVHQLEKHESDPNNIVPLYRYSYGAIFFRTKLN